MNRYFMAICIFCISCASWAQSGLSISLRLIPEKQVLGCPVQVLVTIENSGKIPALVPNDHLIVLVMQLRLEGRAALLGERGGLDGHVTWESLPPGEKRTYCLYEAQGPQGCQPGKCSVWAEYDDTTQSVSPKVSIRMVSERASIEFLAPEGIDKEAFAAATKAMHEAKFTTGSCEPHAISEWFLKTPSFLGRFPASTYAAYVIYGRMAGFAKQDPAVVLGVIHDENSFNSNSYPDDTGQSKDGWRWLKGKEAADWWAKWYDIILKNHPDIWFADELRLKRAVDQLALKNYQTGAADLGTLSKQAKPDVAQKAQQLLEAIKQKGWVKS